MNLAYLQYTGCPDKKRYIFGRDTITWGYELSLTVAEWFQNQFNMLLENITPENLVNHDRPMDSLKTSSVDVERKGKPMLDHILRLYQPDLICNHLGMINNIIKSFISVHSSSPYCQMFWFVLKFYLKLYNHHGYI